jgi:hypothetical protein
MHLLRRSAAASSAAAGRLPSRPARLVCRKVAAVQEQPTASSPSPSEDPAPAGTAALQSSTAEDFRLQRLDAAQEELLKWMLFVDDEAQERDLADMVDYAEFSAAGGEEDDAELTEGVERMLEQSSVDLRMGDRVVGTVYEVDEDGAYVEVGAKTAGFVPLSECSLAKLKSVSERESRISIFCGARPRLLHPQGRSRPAPMAPFDAACHRYRLARPAWDRRGRNGGRGWVWRAAERQREQRERERERERERARRIAPPPLSSLHTPGGGQGPLLLRARARPIGAPTPATHRAGRALPRPAEYLDRPPGARARLAIGGARERPIVRGALSLPPTSPLPLAARRHRSSPPSLPPPPQNQTQNSRSRRCAPASAASSSSSRRRTSSARSSSAWPRSRCVWSMLAA